MPKAIPAYNLHDFRTLTKKRLPKGIFEYIDRGVEDEVALVENRRLHSNLNAARNIDYPVPRRSKCQLDIYLAGFRSTKANAKRSSG